MKIASLPDFWVNLSVVLFTWELQNLNLQNVLYLFLLQTYHHLHYEFILCAFGWKPESSCWHSEKLRHAQWAGWFCCFPTLKESHITNCLCKHLPFQKQFATWHGDGRVVEEAQAQISLDHAQLFTKLFLILVLVRNLQIISKHKH